jgi:hypothetical protein
MGHCFVAHHYQYPPDLLEIYAMLQDEEFVLPPGKQCKTTVKRIFKENGGPLPGWEKPAFAIALGGEIFERITRGQELADVVPDGSTNIEALFRDSPHDYDRVMADAMFGRLRGVTEGRPGEMVTACAVEVFQVLQAAKREIMAEASQLSSWVAELWVAANDQGSRRLKPTAASHWTTLCYVRGSDDLSIFLDDSAWD